MTDKRKALEALDELQLNASGAVWDEHFKTIRQALSEPDNDARLDRIKTFLRMRYGRQLSDVHDDMEFLIGQIEGKARGDELEEAIERVVDFLEQRSVMLGQNPRTIYIVHSNPDKKAASLNTADIETLINAAKPRKKFTKEELVEIAWDAGVDEVDVDALISAGVIDVMEG